MGPKSARVVACGLWVCCLAACGGNGETSVGGSMSGLNTGASVTLQNNNADNLTLTENGPFHFPTFVPGGSTYNVTVLTQPAGQLCSVTSGSGTLDAQGDPVDTVAVACVTTASIGGTVSGLAPGTSLTLRNGGDLLLIDVNGAFAFPGIVAVGSDYAVSVAVQPAGETCTVANGTGTVAAGLVTSISVTCA